MTDNAALIAALYAAAEELRNDTAAADAPVVATISNDAKDKLAAAEAEYAAHISKPAPGRDRHNRWRRAHNAHAAYLYAEVEHYRRLA